MGRYMKILFLAPANSIHTIRWVNALAERENQVLLVSLQDHKKDDIGLTNNVTVKYLKISGLKGYYFNAFELKKIESDFHPNIINVHYASGYGTLARAAKLSNIILSVWGSDVYDFPYESKLKMYIIRKNLLYAKQLLSTSYAMAEQVKKLIGEIEIEVTPFGVDTEKFKKLERKRDSMFSIAVIKTLSSKYGIDTIIKSFAVFKNMIHDHSAIELLIYGNGEQKKELIQLSESLGVEKEVHFMGYINNDKIPEIYANVDIACFGSRLESFGVSAVEAMACEVPVIATDADGFKEVIEDCKTGFIVNQNDIKAMAEYMRWLYFNPKLRNELGQNARKRVMKLYDWNNNVDFMISIYEAVYRRKKC